MSQLDTRQLSRDSLFLMAIVKVIGDAAGREYRVKVRNLSSGGMMAEGVNRVELGSRVYVDLRNIGLVEGSVVWKQSDRFGIAFTDEIDPLLARTNDPEGADLETTPFVRPPQVRAGDPNSSALRKL